jgi:hypothetical protein
MTDCLFIGRLPRDRDSLKADQNRLTPAADEQQITQDKSQLTLFLLK